jgi:hypothetical protein
MRKDMFKFYTKLSLELDVPFDFVMYTYETWRSMKKRCYCSTVPQFKYYGARGITVSDFWISNPKKFIQYIYTELGERPEGHSLDRINNNGDYEPGNIQWASTKEQNQNKGFGISNTKEKHITLINNRGYLYYKLTLLNTKAGKIQAYFDTLEQACIARDTLKTKLKLEK